MKLPAGESLVIDDDKDELLADAMEIFDSPVSPTQNRKPKTLKIYGRNKIRSN